METLSGEPGAQSTCAEPSHAPPELEAFASAVGNFIQYWGFKQIHGRIWCHLFLSQDPLDSRSLVSRLKVSKALISLSIKDLIQHRVVIRAGKSPDGTQLYRANPQVFEAILGVLRQRERKLIREIASAYRALSDLSHLEKNTYRISTLRLHAVGMLIRVAEQGLDTLLEKSPTLPWGRIRDRLHRLERFFH